MSIESTSFLSDNKMDKGVISKKKETIVIILRSSKNLDAAARTLTIHNRYL